MVSPKPRLTDEEFDELMRERVLAIRNGTYHNDKFRSESQEVPTMTTPDIQKTALENALEHIDGELRELQERWSTGGQPPEDLDIKHVEEWIEGWASWLRTRVESKQELRNVLREALGLPRTYLAFPGLWERS